MSIRAADLMTTDVITLTAEMNLLEMDTILFKAGVSGAPVLDQQRLIGIASQVDIIREIWEGHQAPYQQASFYSRPYPLPITALESVVRDGSRLGERFVADVMTRDPLVAHPDDSVSDLADRLVREQIHRLPIVDPDTGHLVGIVSSLDVVHAINRYSLAPSL